MKVHGKLIFSPASDIFGSEDVTAKRKLFLKDMKSLV